MNQIGDRNGSQRIDKWLNYACLFKTRSKATKACEARRIKINDDVAKPSHQVKAGDRVTIKLPSGRFVNMNVLAVVYRNVSSKDAKLLYNVEDLQLSEEVKELMELFGQAVTFHKPKYKGRPTKKERRTLDKFKQEGSSF
jgi:ribosome-associated heat shock protein Hsp15